VAHDISGKFGLWTFHTLLKRQKILTLLTFGCPTDNGSFGNVSLFTVSDHVVQRLM